jgi:hypothetical protein
LLKRAGAMLLGLGLSSAHAEIYRVGPEREFKQLADVAEKLDPGDSVEVDGGATYSKTVTFTRHGTAEAPIIVRGIRRDGARPLLVPPHPHLIAALVRFDGDHYRFEGFEFTGGSSFKLMRAIYNIANDIVIRDTLIRDCPLNGIAGSDRSGSLTLDGVEIRGCGRGSLSHSIYVGSDHSRYPNAVFRMQFCHIHDGNGGNLVKSRAALTEIYYCRIERAAFFELDLIGGDPGAQEAEADRAVKESADLVGNLVASKPKSRGAIARLGSDGTGASEGHYRFAHNTIIHDQTSGPFFQVRGRIASVAFYNNAIVRSSGDGAFWAAPFGVGRMPDLSGDGNWVSESTARLPDKLDASLRGSIPEFDRPPDPFRPAPSSPLRDAAADLPASFLAPPEFEPVGTDGSRVARTPNGRADIGAFEGR